MIITLRMPLCIGLLESVSLVGAVACCSWGGDWGGGADCDSFAFASFIIFTIWLCVSKLTVFFGIPGAGLNWLLVSTMSKKPILGAFDRTAAETVSALSFIILDMWARMFTRVNERWMYELFISNLGDEAYESSFLVQLPHARMWSHMKSDFSGADEMLNGCHSYLATTGMFTNT